MILNLTVMKSCSTTLFGAKNQVLVLLVYFLSVYTVFVGYIIHVSETLVFVQTRTTNAHVLVFDSPQGGSDTN